MRRAGLYIMAMMTAGIVMWKTPIISYAEPVMVEANEMEANSEEASPVVEVPTEIDDTANAGPDLEMQNQLREEAEAQQAANQAAETRQNLVNYALQFVGGPYRAGGNDPRTGVDCSGFVKFVMQNGAGIGMNRSSATQATQGK